MKQVTVFCVVVVMWMVSGASANVEVFEICTGSAKQQNPSLDGRYTVWQDDRSGATNQDIYAYDLQTEHEFAVCTAPGRQRYPSISGDLIVWQDDRNGKWDIYGYDLSVEQPQDREFVISEHPHNQEYPAVSGRFVIWGDRRNGTLDLYGYDLMDQVEFEIASHPTVSLMQPDIDGDWVVWYDDRSGLYQVYACRLEFPIPDGGFEVLHVSPSDNAQGFPSVSGDRVVWHQQNSVGGYDIAGCNLQTGESFTVFEGGDGRYPSVSGTTVVWEDYRNGKDRTDIFGRDLASGGVFEISATVAKQARPVIDGQTIIWQHNEDLWAAYLLEPTVLTVIWPDGGQMLLAGSEQDILWQTEGPALEQVKLEFSADDGTNWHVIEPNVPDTGAYVWQIPEVDSPVCRVRVGDVGGSGAIGVSASVFTVFQCDPALTADLNGDCRVDIADFAVFAEQWTQCGNRYDPDWCWQ